MSDAFRPPSSEVRSAAPAASWAPSPRFGVLGGSLIGLAAALATLLITLVLGGNLLVWAGLVDVSAGDTWEELREAGYSLPHLLRLGIRAGAWLLAGMAGGWFGQRFSSARWPLVLIPSMVIASLSLLQFSQQGEQFAMVAILAAGLMTGSWLAIAQLRRSGRVPKSPSVAAS